MIRRNYCFVCFGVFLFFQTSPGDSSASSNSDTILDDVLIDIPFNPVCPAGCATCSTYNGCVTCQTTHFLLLLWHGMRQTGTCVRACPTGYFGTRKRLHGKCLKCGMSNCVECANNSTCTTCSSPLFASKGRCVDICPKSKPFATKERRCRKQVDCELGEWSSWDSCSRNGVNCGTKFGRQMRTRLVLQEPSENGRKCETTVETRKCKLEQCDCEVLTNESDPSQVGTADGKIKDFSDSPKKNQKAKKPPKKCRQRKNKKHSTKPTTKPEGQQQRKTTTTTATPMKFTTKSDELRRKPMATPKPMKKTTITKKTTKVLPSSS